MIIDIHTHIFPEKIAAATVSTLAKNSNIPPHSDGTLSGLLSALSEAGADIAVNQPVLTKPTQFESVMRFAKEINGREYEGPRVISFAGMHPDIEDVEGCMKRIYEEGFVGIKLHPDYQNTFIDDERYVRIFSEAKRYGLTVLTHSGLDGAYIGQPIKCTPRRVLNLLDRIGGYEKIILAHLGANELYEETYLELCGRDVYFDTAYSLKSAGDMFLKILSKHGDERILFGSDSPWQNIGREVEIIKGYRLGKACEERIFSANARKILGLSKEA